MAPIKLFLEDKGVLMISLPPTVLLAMTIMRMTINIIIMNRMIVTLQASFLLFILPIPFLIHLHRRIRTMERVIRWILRRFLLPEIN